MNLKFFSKPVSRDRVMVINGEKIEVLPVLAADSETVVTEFNVFPRADATIKFDPNGGVVYLYNCDLPYLQETEHLKQIEESIVLKGLFDFGTGEKKGDLRFYILAGLLLVTILVLGLGR